MPKNKIILFCFLFSRIGLHPIAAISLEKTAIEQKNSSSHTRGKMQRSALHSRSTDNYLRLTTNIDIR